MSDTLEAGREFDALIAEKVMGWCWLGRSGKKFFGPSERVGTDADDTNGPIRLAVDSDDTEEAWWMGDERQYEDLWIVPHYSTDIADAFKVVEKMRDMGFEATLTFSPRGGMVSASCEVARLAWTGSVYEESEFAPLSICRAAIEALENAQPISLPSSSEEEQ